MSEEEIKGTLKLIHERLDTIIGILNRMENRQVEVKKGNRDRAGSRIIREIELIKKRNKTLWPLQRELLP